MTRDHDHLTRRVVIRGAGVLGATAVGVLAGCGADDDGTSAPPASDPATHAPPTRAADPTTDPPAAGPTGEPDQPAVDSLAPLGDIPVGGAIAATASDGSEVILARPSEDEVVGFSAVCTHQGCIVAPAEDELQCPCHGSVFDLLTGENVSGPAPSPLDSFAVRVDGDAVVEA